jgi:OST3 / OST6 family, transporter family
LYSLHAFPVSPLQVSLPVPDFSSFIPGRKLATAFLLATYAIMTSGVFYNVIMETPMVGQSWKNGKIVAQFVSERMNSQFQMEGLVAGGSMTCAALGFILLDAGGRLKKPSDRWLWLKGEYLLVLGMALVVLGIGLLWKFFSIKMPGYLTVSRRE